MPESVDIQEEANKYIDTFFRKAIDELVFRLESKFDYTFSPATTLTLVLLATEFIARFSNTVNSEDLMEPERFEISDFNRKI